MTTKPRGSWYVYFVDLKQKPTHHYVTITLAGNVVWWIAHINGLVEINPPYNKHNIKTSSFILLYIIIKVQPLRTIRYNWATVMSAFYTKL